MALVDILLKIFKDPNVRKINKIMPIVDRINELEPEFASLSDEELKIGLKQISNDYHVSQFNIEYRKLGDIKLNSEIEEFVSKPIFIHSHAMSYKTLSLKVLGEDGKLYE